MIANIEKADADYTDTFVALFRENELFPTSFLEQLEPVSVATEVFLKDRTPDNARKLIKSYERASEEYLKAARSGTAVFDKISSYVRPNRPLLYFFVDSFTSTGLVARDYNLIEKNAQALVSEVEHRKECLAGKGSCEPAKEADIAGFFADLNQEIDFTNETIDFVKTTLPGQGGQKEVRGPYQATSSCWGEDNGSYWLYLIYVTKPDRPTYVMPKVVDRNYYRLVSASSTDSISQAVIAKGFSFYSQLETTTYECTDLTFYPRLLALDTIKHHLEDSDLTSTAIEDDITYHRFAENQFGVLGSAFLALASYTDLLESSQHTEKSFVISPQFLFTTRSAYALTFMPFARSIWRIDEKPTYLHSQKDREQTGMKSGFVTYSELKEQGYTDEKIRSSHLNQSELIDSIKND